MKACSLKNIAQVCNIGNLLCGWKVRMFRHYLLDTSNLLISSGNVQAGQTRASVCALTKRYSKMRCPGFIACTRKASRNFETAPTQNFQGLSVHSKVGLSRTVLLETSDLHNHEFGHVVKRVTRPSKCTDTKFRTSELVLDNASLKVFSLQKSALHKH